MSDAGAKPKTWLENMFSNLKNEASSLFQSFVNVVKHDAWPFVENLFITIELDAQAKLQPLAVAAADEVLAELPTAFSNPSGFLGAVHATGVKLFQKAEAAVINVGETDILTAAHAAVLNSKAKLAGG